MKKEFAQAKECDELIEDLGNAMCRVYLGAVKKENIDIIKVGEAFIDSANEIKGDVSRFEQSLVDLLMECKKGNLPFSINELSIYIMQYKEKGYPPVSHSEVYRENYAPSYRVMHKKYAENLFCEGNNK